MRGSVWLRGVFYLLVVLCLAQLAWWTYFAFQASDDVERLDLLRLESRAFRAVHVLESRPLAALPPAERRAAIQRLLAAEYPYLEVVEEEDPIAEDAAVIRSFSAGPGVHYLVRPRESARLAAVEQGDRTRRMFVHESIAFGLVVLTGVLLIRVLSIRESKLRAQQQRFLTGATHELKTPLASLRLGLQSFAQGSVPPEKLPHYSEQMVEQVDRLEMDIENLLRSAAGGDKVFDLREGDLGADIAAVAAEFEQRFGAYGIQLDFVHEAENIVVARDAGALRQILRNLLDNACKYSPRGGRITLRLRADPRHAYVSVQDRGKGIAAEDRERLFERFYRGAATQSGSEGGTGLGLWLSRRLARAHGGELALVSGHGEGACFELRLPRPSRELERA